MASAQCGIVYYGTENTLEYLPLEELRARVQIVDVSARVILTQVYSNFSNLPTRRAKYMFPIPAGAAIAGFELSISDGTRLVGKCMERVAATSEYQRAIVSGRSAGLLDYVTEDIFVISVGAIPAGETAETKLTYVMSLQNDDIVNSLRFSLPTYVGQRYGVTPSEMTDASRPSTTTRIRVTVDIQTSGSIKSIHTPDYEEYITIKRTHQDGRLSKRRATIKLRSRDYLEKEFVVICAADKLDKPRCFAEIMELDGRYSLALQLTLIPKYDLPPIPEQEYIFLMDRSGSMNGDPIEQAKKTAITLIHLLPKDGTLFNVFIFDNVVESVWASSQPYSADALRVAGDFVRSIQSGGGTEIGKALQHVLNSRNIHVPTTVFVLTDGEAYDVTGTAAIVRQACQQATLEARLQVFTLGIGNQVSTHMCDAIADAGNGVAFYSRTAHGIIGQSRRLLQAGKAQFVDNIFVDWSVSSNYLARPDAIPRRRSSTYQTLIPDLPVQQQSPPHVPQLHAESRVYIYAIISLRRSFVPRRITLSGSVTNLTQSSDFALEVPVREVKMADTDPQLHALAAWNLIQDHQGGHANIPLSASPISAEEMHKAAIVKLGEKYQVASKYTSFVAVESPRGRERRSHTSTTNALASQSSISLPIPTSLPDIFATFRSFVSSFLSGASNRSTPSGSRPTPPRASDPGVPGAFPGSRSVSRPSVYPSGSSGSSSSAPGDEDENNTPLPRGTSRGRDELDADADVASEGSFESYSTMSSLNDLFEWSDWSEESLPERRYSRIERYRMRSPSPFRRTVDEAPPEIRDQILNQPRAPTPELPQSSDVDPEVYEVLAEAEYDGSFKLDTAKQFLGSSVIRDQSNADEETWATALCVAFLLKKLGAGDVEEFLSKSLEFLKSKQDGKRLLDRARELLK